MIQFVGIMFVVGFLSMLCGFLEHAFTSNNPDSIEHRRKFRLERKEKRERAKRSNNRIDPRKISKKLKGRVVKEEGDPVIEFRKGLYKYRVEIRTRHRTHSIHVQTKWPDYEVRLRMFPRGKGKSFPKLKGIRAEHHGFDKQFVVQGEPVEKVKPLFSKRVCRKILQHKTLAHNRVEINISGGKIHLGGMATRILQVGQIVAVIRNLTAIHKQMSHRRDSAARNVDVVDHVKLDVKIVELEQSLCMVCGDVVDDDTGVDCSSCDTRHHLECWKYIGKCSTYGCRSRRFNGKSSHQ